MVNSPPMAPITMKSAKNRQIHFNISIAPMTTPPIPNAINHQVSIPMPSKMVKTLTTVKANPSQILVLSLLLDRRIATCQSLSMRDPIHSPPTQSEPE